MTISRELAERVCPCAAVVPGRVYPLERDAGVRTDDGEWANLVGEVADLLGAFGFPMVEPDTADWYALSWCLWRYVYGHQARGRHGVDPAAGSGTGGSV